MVHLSQAFVLNFSGKGGWGLIRAGAIRWFRAGAKTASVAVRAAPLGSVFVLSLIRDVAILSLIRDVAPHAANGAFCRRAPNRGLSPDPQPIAPNAYELVAPRLVRVDLC